VRPRWYATRQNCPPGLLRIHRRMRRRRRTHCPPDVPPCMLPLRPACDGELAEWLMAPVLKTGIPGRVSGVRIPHSPPDLFRARLQQSCYFSVTSPMNTPNAGRVTSDPLASAPGVASNPFSVAREDPWPVRLKLAFWADADMFSATRTDLPL
jgi:hypothetical protein